MIKKLERKPNELNRGHTVFEVPVQLGVSSHAPTQMPVQV